VEVILHAYSVCLAIFSDAIVANGFSLCGTLGLIQGWMDRDVSVSNIMAIEGEDPPAVQEYVSRVILEPHKNADS
jgi:hypothetical protein